jgi:hypothetical protein
MLTATTRDYQIAAAQQQATSHVPFPFYIFFISVFVGR